jgi:hypothetical protein
VKQKIIQLHYVKLCKKSSAKHTVNCNDGTGGSSYSSQADKNKEIPFVPLQDEYQL